MIFVLIDIRIGFMQTDLDALNLMMQYNRPISIVFTKIDKLNPKELMASKEIMQVMLKDFDILDKYYYISNKHPKDGDLIDLKKKIDTLFNNK
jgi:GTP-binding protein EngB required for normal cell division